MRIDHGCCIAEHNRPGPAVGPHAVTSNSTPAKPGVLMAGLEHVVLDEHANTLIKVCKDCVGCMGAVGRVHGDGW